jgi:transketolase
MIVKPLNIKNRLAERPTSELKHFTEVNKQNGSKQKLATPSASRALLALMDAEATLGGAACHWGGASAFTEIVSSVHGFLFSESAKSWYEEYNYVNDAGHCENGIYAVRALYGHDNLDYNSLKGFRSVESKLTGHGESMHNPEGVLLSNGPLGSAVAQAQGLAMADKLSGNDRLTLLTLSDGASMEGEVKEAFASIPGFARASKLNPFVLVISDNNTKLSGRIDEDSFSMQGTFAGLKALGWDLIELGQGHDLQTVYSNLETAIAKAKANPEVPVCIWVNTVKGYGVKATAESASGGHGFPGSAVENIREFIGEIYGSESIPADIDAWISEVESKFADKQAKKVEASEARSVKREKVQAGFGRALVKVAENGLPVVAVSSDLQGSTGVAPLHKAFPQNCFDIGVAESNMVSVAAGLSKAGYLPVVDTFAQFGVTKGNLPLVMASLSEAPIVAAFTHVGFQDAADGASHQASTYISAVASIPDVTVVNCSCSAEAESYMIQAFEMQKEKKEAGEVPNSVIFFAGRENYPTFYDENAKYEWGQAQVLGEGKDLVIAATGHMVDYALQACEQLKEEGISASVINIPFVNEIDIETIAPIVQGANSRLITFEDHQIKGGMGSYLIQALSQAGVPVDATCIGIQNAFGRSSYTAQAIYDEYGMAIKDVVDAAKRF